MAHAMRSRTMNDEHLRDSNTAHDWAGVFELCFNDPSTSSQFGAVFRKGLSVQCRKLASNFHRRYSQQYVEHPGDPSCGKRAFAGAHPAPKYCSTCITAPPPYELSLTSNIDFILPPTVACLITATRKMFSGDAALLAGDAKALVQQRTTRRGIV